MKDPNAFIWMNKNLPSTKAELEDILSILKPILREDEIVAFFSSPKKRNVPTRTGISYIPAEILREIMLNMDGNDLKEFCATHRRAAEICRNRHFIDQYKKIHPSNWKMIGKGLMMMKYIE